MKLHHIGFVTADVGEQALRFERQFGFQLLGPPVDDELQKSRIALIGTNSDVLIELIEPIGEDSPVAKKLEKGGGLAHLCYATNDMDQAIEHLKSTGAAPVSEPKPSAAFEGCRVAFLYTKDHQLVEIIEEPD